MCPRPLPSPLFFVAVAVANVLLFLGGTLEAAPPSATSIFPVADDGSAAALPPPSPYSVVGHMGPLPAATKGGGGQFRCVLELYDAVRTWPVVPLAVKVGEPENQKNKIKYLNHLNF
jgi:hypothetical protein